MSDLGFKEKYFEGKYLSEEERYKEILNQNEIDRIENSKLRSIRSKYWHLRHKVFLDEHGIPDSELGTVWDELCKKEQAEINEYRKRKEIV